MKHTQPLPSPMSKALMLHAPMFLQIHLHIRRANRMGGGLVLGEHDKRFGFLLNEISLYDWGAVACFNRTILLLRHTCTVDYLARLLC